MPEEMADGALRLMAMGSLIMRLHGFGNSNRSLPKPPFPYSDSSIMPRDHDLRILEC